MTETKKRSKASGYFSIMGNLDWIMPEILPLLPTDYINQCEVTGGRGELLWHTPKPKGLEFFNDKDSDIIRVHRTVQRMTEEEMITFENFNWVQTKEHFDSLKKFRSENDLEFLYQYLYILGSGKRHSEIWKDTFLINKEGKKINPINRIKNIQERIKDITFTNLDAISFLNMTDAEDTFLFLDPPYPSRERYYTVHDLDWEELYNTLIGLKSKWMMVYDPTLSPRVGTVIKKKSELEYIYKCSEFAYRLSNEFHSEIFTSAYKMNSVFKKLNFKERTKEYHVVMNY